MRNVRLLARMLGLSLVLALGVCAYPAEAVAAWGLTTRVSVDSSDVQGNGFSTMPAVSADGRYVAFASDATTLVAGDTNGSRDIFVRDRITRATTRVSVNSAGVQGNAYSDSCSISSDGRYVAFVSDATNLVDGDTTGLRDVFVRDRVTSVTTRVSVNSGLAASNGYSYSCSISSDGRYVAFSSQATNLVADDTNGVEDVFVRDRVTNVTTRVSVDSALLPLQGDLTSEDPRISSDGRYVAFHSWATNLVTLDTNARADVFVRDRVTNVTTRVSVDSAGLQVVGNSMHPSISSDGRFVAFESLAAGLVPDDTNNTWDIFVHDRVTNATTRMSVDSALVPLQGDGASQSPAISADGRRVVFGSLATNLVAGDTNAASDVFVRDRVTNVTTRVSVDSALLPLQGDGASQSPAISADGRYVVFGSLATNLVAGDTNATSDIFVREAPAMITSITIKTTATTALTGSVPILSGAVTPVNMIGRNIVVYVKKPGKTYWSYSSNRTAYNLGGKAAWQYKYYFKAGMVKGYYVFKAVAPAPGFASSLGFLTSTSPTTVTIRLR